MKVSIVTAAYNSARTLGDAMKSVLSQTYHDIEYIVIDGCSTDTTVSVIQEYEPLFEGRLKWVSEKDGGIYDAMNKGIQMATGDVVGILNSDDYFTSCDVIERMVAAFEDQSLDAVYGDIHFIHDGEPDKCVRYYSSKPFRPLWLRFGFMPAHPSFYCRRGVYERAGLYKTDYQIGSDDYLGVAFRFAKQVEIEERYQGSDDSCYQEGIGMDKYLVLDEIRQKSHQCYDGESGCQTVDAVYQVYGIVDEYHDEDGQGNADIGGNLTDAKQSVEVVDIESAKG